MSNNNNATPAGGGRGRKRGRRGAAPGGSNPPPAKKRKTRAKRREARNGRAMTQRGDQLTGKGRTRNSTTNRTEMVIEEDEYIAEVTPSGEPAFANVAYSVNPGQVGTFPWLSTIAKNFEKYEFEYLEFYYKREVSEYASNGQTGKVILSFETDASDAPPTTKTQIEATDPHEDGMPCENFALKVPQSMLCTRMDAHYVRPGAQPAGTDIKTYDVGNLNVATIGTAANTAVGELHVRYRVRLFIPVIEGTGGGGSGAPGTSKVGAWFQSSSAEASGATGVATKLLAATASSNGPGIVNTSGSFVPPAGNWQIDVDMVIGWSSDNPTKIELDVQKNAATVYAGAALHPTTTDTPTEPANNQLHASVMVTANGTDAFTFLYTQTGGATANSWGSVRWLSV